TCVVLRKGNELADVTATTEKAYPPIETESRTAVWWSTILEGVQQETEFVTSIFIGKAQHTEHGFLHAAIMDADAASSDLGAIDHEVVRVRLHRTGIAFQQMRMLGDR